MEVKTFTRLSTTEEKTSKIIRLPDKSDILNSILLLCLSRASLLGMFPFSVAMFGAVYDKRVAYLGIATMLLGLLTKGVGTNSIKYVFAALVYWLFTRLKPENDNKILSAAVCGGSILLCGGVLLPYINPTLYGAMILVAESVLSAFLFIVFDKAKVLVYGRGNRTQIGQEELICLAVCVGGFITGFSGINFPFNISISNILTMYTVMTISMHVSLGMAGVGGLIMGLMAGMDSENAILYMGLYGLFAMFGNLLKSFGKWGISLGYLGGSAVALLYIGSVFKFPVGITEIFITSALIIGTPKKVNYSIGAFLSRSFHMEVIRADIRVKEYLSNQLEKIAKSFDKLEECFFNVSEKRLKMHTNEVADMFDSVADKVCESCGMNKQCWQKEFNDTYRQMFTILDTIDKKGYCDSANAPELFKDKCVRLESFLIEFSHMYEVYKQKAVWIGEAATGRDLVAKQYHEISNIMDNLSAEISNGFSFLEELENTVIEELDKKGFIAREVSIIENGIGGLEVYLSVGFGTNIKAIASELSSILDTPIELSEIVNGVCKFVSRNVYTVEIGVRQMCKENNDICGDNIVHFKTSDNKYCIVMCDGMGSGSVAYKESELTGNLLKEFLMAGFNKATAIEIINSTLSLKMDNECFSTIDLLVIDLMTGIGEFVKIGGAESFIKKGDDVEAVFSKTLPAGMLGEISTSSITRGFNGDEVILMATDGVTESGTGIIRGEWIKKLMNNAEDMESLAEEIIDGAVKKSGGRINDDMTVAAIKITKEVA